MNHGPQATEKFFNELSHKASALSTEAKQKFSSKRVQAWICVPAVSLTRALELGRSFHVPIEVAAQNAHWEKSGAYTGELSGPLLQEIGIQRVLIGHSERRQYFGETDETVRKRTESLLQQGFQVILCAGETRAEREAGKTEEVLKTQLSAVFKDPGKGASTFLDGRLVIAYEPVWAIGTGLTATPEQAEEAHQFIRKFLETQVSGAASERTKILYGGSVTPENVNTLLSCANVDGALVGGASLKPESFFVLVSAGIQQS